MHRLILAVLFSTLCVLSLRGVEPDPPTVNTVENATKALEALLADPDSDRSDIFKAVTRLNSVASDEKVQKLIQAAMDEIKQRMTKDTDSETANRRGDKKRKQNHQELRTSFSMTEEDFAAIEPLLIKVENLVIQKYLIGLDHGPLPSRHQRKLTSMLLSLFPDPSLLDPSVKEIQDATMALEVLLADTKVDAAQTAVALTRVRQSREAFNAILVKARNELRAVLTTRQEALLFEQSILE